MNQYAKIDAHSAKCGREAFLRGDARSSNPFIGRKAHANISCEMWDRGYCKAAGLSSLKWDADMAAKMAAADKKHADRDAQVAAAFPAEWAHSSEKSGPKRRESRRVLRRKYEALLSG